METITLTIPRALCDFIQSSVGPASALIKQPRAPQGVIAATRYRVSIELDLHRCGIWLEEAEEALQAPWLSDGNKTVIAQTKASIEEAQGKLLAAELA